MDLEKLKEGLRDLLPKDTSREFRVTAPDFIENNREEIDRLLQTARNADTLPIEQEERHRLELHAEEITRALRTYDRTRDGLDFRERVWIADKVKNGLETLKDLVSQFMGDKGGARQLSQMPEGTTFKQYLNLTK